MNLRFKRVDIENFRSIDKAIVTLENQGIVIVKGINEYEDKATSNGSGKSSVFESIIFALFEETSNGEKDVANRIIGNGYKVTLYFDIDESSYTIIRSCEGSKTNVQLFKNDVDISARNKTDTNKLILSILGLNKSVFLDSIFLSQGANTNLSTLSPTARKERLEVLTNTDAVVNEFKEKLKGIQSKYEQLSLESQREVNTLQGNLQALETQKQTYLNKIEEVNQQIAKRNALGNIEDIEKNIKELEEELENLTHKLEDKEKEITNKEKEIEEFRKTSDEDRNKKEKLAEDLNTKRTEYRDLQNSFSNETFKMDVAQKEIIRLEGEITKIKNSDTCPTCGRKYDNVNEEHIQKTIKEYMDKIEEQKTILNQTTEVQTTLTKQIEDKEAEGKNVSQLIQAVDEKLDIFKTQLDVKEQQKKELNNDKIMINYSIQEQQNKMKELRNRKDEILKIEVGNKEEFEKMLQEVELEINKINTKLQEENKNYQESNNYVECAKHCIQLVTKDFRTYLLKNSINYLNTVLENYSKMLFSNDRDVIRISNNDTKLDITLGNATYESLSGGEKTRVNIALLLAQKSLANIIGNINCNMIILDEILGYCDSQAEINIIDLITKELESLESIYMVSHKEIPIGYDTQLIVVKDKNGLSNVKTY